MTLTRTAGIIANPASGKDIRRLVAHGSTFDNNEKINIVRRVLLAMDAVGVERVWYMPDSYAIVPRAADTIQIRLTLDPLPMEILANPSDSYEAARRLEDLDCGCVVSLGGDGTNRMIAKGIGDVPLVAVSTGTNNVFPRMIEGTIAGLAAGFVAVDESCRTAAVKRVPKLDVLLDGELKEIALIDAVTSNHAWIGARALWDASHLREVVLSRVAAAEIGICGLGGLLHPGESKSGNGVHLRIGSGGTTVLAPIAPGLMREVPVASSTVLSPGSTVELDSAPCTVALDGEREFEILKPGDHLAVRFNSDGPRVVDVEAAVGMAATTGLFTRR